MAILNVTANHDYRLDDLSNITEIHFAGAFTAIFDQSQFGGGGISNSALITGGAFDEILRSSRCASRRAATGFSAAQWDVPAGGRSSGWSAARRAKPSPACDGNSAVNHEFIGGGGADTLIGGSGDDTFIYAATGDVEPGEKIDGRGDDYDDNTYRCAPPTTSGERTSPVSSRIEILGAGTTATFFDDQLSPPRNFFEGIEEVEYGGRAEKDGRTVQTLVVQANSERYFVPGEPDASATLKYVSFRRVGARKIGSSSTGPQEDDYLFGSNKADTFDAGAGKDELFGRQGKDTLDGGAGRDRLDGGSGRRTCSPAAPTRTPSSSPRR